MQQGRRPGSGFYAESACALSEFLELIDARVAPDQVPQADGIEQNIPVYDVPGLLSDLLRAETRMHLMAEWAWILHSGPGVFVLRRACDDLEAIDRATRVFEGIIDQERAGGSGADHFAAAGSNDRVWNALQKLCLADPETHMRYFGMPAIDAACEAWLGPNYQMTAQVNLVHPGGQAQDAHRDYHLGFQTADVTARYPAHVHDLSPLMTLQGGIAHCDMPLESGPTKLLPFSQLYRPGYVAWRRPDFRAVFEDRCVQVPLSKGDALFFNPALFHAAGENRSAGIERLVNLLQISSAFGRAMESVDRGAMSRALFPVLCRAWSEHSLSEAQLDAVIAATAEGYSFPTNLDRDPPAGGLAPKTQQALLKEAVLDGMEPARFRKALQALSERQRP